MAGGGGAGGMAGGMGQQPGGMGGQIPSYMGSQGAREFNPNPMNAGFGPNVDNFGATPMQQGMPPQMQQGAPSQMQMPPALQQAMQQRMMQGLPQQNQMQPRMMQGSLQPNSIPEYARPYVQQQQDPAQQMNNLNNMSNMLRGRPGMPGMMPNQIPNPSQVNSMPPRMMQAPPSPSPMQQPSGGITRLTRPNRLRGR